MMSRALLIRLPFVYFSDDLEYLECLYNALKFLGTEPKLQYKVIYPDNRKTVDYDSLLLPGIYYVGEQPSDSEIKILIEKARELN